MGKFNFKDEQDFDEVNRKAEISIFGASFPIGRLILKIVGVSCIAATPRRTEKLKNAAQGGVL